MKLQPLNSPKSMLKVFRPRPWICSRCLRQQVRRRGLQSLAAAPRQPDNERQVLISQFPMSPPKDDSTIRRNFDSQSFWKEFSVSATQSLRRPAGLLRNNYLTSPEGFQKFTTDALQKCQNIVSKVISASSNDEYRSVVRDLDRLSDQLCRVIDLSDFIRNVHPDPRIQLAASQAYGQMFEYMNVLNTTVGLESQLRKAMSISEVTSTWNEEEKVTADILLRDFEKSGIGGSEAQHKRFVELSSEIVEVGSQVLELMAPEKFELQFASSRLNGMDPVEVKKRTKWGTTTIPTHGRTSNLALKTVEDAEVRKELYIESRKSSKESIARVELLARCRAELANMSGHESFAQLTLSDKMAGTPEAVESFLLALAKDNKSKVNADLQQILAVQARDPTRLNIPNAINAWDRAFYTHRLRSQLYPTSRPADVLASYFSVGTVIQGLSRLFSRLYGIRLVPTPTAPGEAWNDDVRRLDVIDEDEGHIAVLYCDLFERPYKSPNPAHFTLRCSREITAREVGQVAHTLPANPTLDDFSAALNDGMALSRSRTGSLRQLPTIAFICDFARPSAHAKQPALLTFSQVTTLFHEMGHALHSIVGRTALQNVAGTRCATDFAELPSVLMEDFAASPDVLSLYARHWETDQPLNVDLVAEELRRERTLREGHNTESQIAFSVLDQRYHSAEVVRAVTNGEKWDSTRVYQEVFSDPRFASVAEPEGTSWQGFFGHLFGYGAVYYSYLFDRAIAGKVWREVFRDGPLDRSRGERYKELVLRWGGARDGWRCIAGVLGPEMEWIGEGGRKAMKEVGRWGVRDPGDV